MSNKFMVKIIFVVCIATMLVGSLLIFWENRNRKKEEEMILSEEIISDEEIKKDEVIEIGISLASASTMYQNELATKMKEISQNKDTYNVTFAYAEWDVECQENQLRDFMKKGVDVIILCPVNAKSLLNVLKDLKKENIPVINLNMKVDQVSAEYITTYVGGSMSEEANLAAELVAEILDGQKGKVGIIEGLPGSEPQIYRTQTFLETITTYPDIEVVGIVDGKWEKSTAHLAALDLLNKSPDINLIYCHDCNMAMGAYEALVQKGKENEIKIIGIGDPLKYEQELKEGKLYGIISQSVDYEAEYALICAEKAARGSVLRPWYKNSSEIITSENIDNYNSPMDVEQNHIIYQ